MTPCGDAGPGFVNPVLLQRMPPFYAGSLKKALTLAKHPFVLSLAGFKPVPPGTIVP